MFWRASRNILGSGMFRNLKSHLHRVPRNIIYIAIIGFILAYVPISALYRSGVPQETLRKKIESELSTTFRREVSVESISGNLFSQVKLKNTKVASFDTLENGLIFDIEEMTAGISLLGIIVSRGDIIGSLDTLALRNITMNMVRNEADNWNLFDIFVPKNNKGPKAPIFGAAIYIQNLHGAYIDQKGWADTPQTFTAHGASINGKINFANLGDVKFNIAGLLKDTQMPISFTGNLNAKTGTYKFKFNAPRLQVNKWVPYVFPDPEYTITGDTLQVYGSLTSEKKHQKNNPPFIYDITATAAGLNIKTPFLPKTFTEATTEFGITNKRNDVILSLKNSTAKLNTINVAGGAKINLTQETLTLTGRTRGQFELNKLQDLFPVLNTWEYSGKGRGDIAITGSYSRPLIKTNLDIAALNLYEQSPKNGHLELQVLDDIMTLNLSDMALYKGTLSANGEINIAETTPSFSIDITASAMDLHDMLPPIKAHTSAQISGTAHLHGNSDVFKIDAKIQDPNWKVLNQSIEESTWRMDFTEMDKIQIQNLHVGFKNGGALKGDGLITNQEDISLSLKGQNILINDLSPERNTGKTGKLNAEITYSVPIPEAKREEKGAKATIDIQLSDAELWGSPIYKLVLKADYNNAETDIKSFTATHKAQKLELTGHLKNNRPQTLWIKTKNLDLKSAGWLQSHLPDKYKPIEGKLSSEFTLTSKRAKGDAQLDSGQIQNTKFKSLKIVGEGDQDQLNLEKLSLITKQSQIKLSGTISSQNLDIKISPDTKINVRDFPNWFYPREIASGRSTLSGSVKGPISSPIIELKLKAKNIEYKDFWIDELTGRIIKKDLFLEMSALTIKQGISSIVLSGHIDLSPFSDYEKDINVDELDYNLSAKFKDINIETTLDILEKTYRETQLSRKEDTQNTHSYVFTYPQKINKDRIVYRRYDSNDVLANISKVRKTSQKQETKTILSDYFKGTLNGNIRAYTIPKKNPYLSGTLKIKTALMGIITAKEALIKLNPGKETELALELKTAELSGSSFETLKLNTKFDEAGNIKIQNLDIETNHKRITDALTGYFPLSAYWRDEWKEKPLNLQAKLEGDDIDILSILSPYINRLESEGSLHLDIKGTLEKPDITASKSNLKNLKITFNPETSIFLDPFEIPNPKVTLKNNQIHIATTDIFWGHKNGKPFYKITNSKLRKNKLKLTGDIMLTEFNALKADYLKWDIDLKTSDETLNLFLSNGFLGETTIKDILIKGPYHIPLSDMAQDDVSKTIGTESEIGPLVSGKMDIKNGRIKIPSVLATSESPTFKLDLEMNLGEDMTIEGGFFGGGLFTFANTMYFEVQKTETPFKLTGTLNVPKIDTTLVVEDGTLTLFDRVFEIMPESKQRQFFRETPESVGKNTISFITDTPKDAKKPKMIPVLNLKTITFIEEFKESSTTENAINTPQQVDYTGVVLLIEGRLDNLGETLIVEEYKTASPLASNLNPEFIGRYDVAISGGKDEYQTQSGLNLILPEFFQNPDDAKFDKLSETQANLWFRRGVRPLEKNIAERVGLYDLRIDYDIGRALSQSGETSAATGQELLGLNLIWGFYNEKLFLRMRTDVNLSNEDTRDQNGLRVTELEASYFITRRFTVNLSNIAEYSGDTEFKPRPSTKYSYEF